MREINTTQSDGGFQAIASRQIKLAGGLNRGGLVNQMNRLMITCPINVCTMKTKQLNESSYSKPRRVEVITDGR